MVFAEKTCLDMMVGCRLIAYQSHGNQNQNNGFRLNHCRVSGVLPRTHLTFKYSRKADGTGRSFPKDHFCLNVD
jgi:hypothetical protein